jgi:S1-C subfamily serine protease
MICSSGVRQPSIDAGLSAYGFIMKIDDTYISGSQDVASAIQGLSPGDKVTITFDDYSQRQMRITEATLGRRSSG